VFSLSSLDPASRALVSAASEIPLALLEPAHNLFALLNALHFLTGKVYSTRHTQVANTVVRKLRDVNQFV
jgi:hypothetical protein